MRLWTLAINNSPLMPTWGGVKKSAEARPQGWLKVFFVVVSVFGLFCFDFFVQRWVRPARVQKPMTRRNKGGQI